MAHRRHAPEDLGPDPRAAHETAARGLLEEALGRQGRRAAAQHRPTDAFAARRRQVVKELLVDLRRLDKQRKQADAELDQALADYGTCLTDIDGISRVAAATIIAG